MKTLLPFFIAILCTFNVLSQSTVTIDVQTDDYGYEIYWQLLPGGNACGTGTIFAGGNTAVGCGGAGLQNQAPGGYANNVTITEGPWILTTGATYDIFFADDWGDGGAVFTVYIDGFPVYAGMTGSGDTPGNTFSFTVTPPLAFDMAGIDITTFNYVNIGNVDVKGNLFNRSSNIITSLDLNYQIDSDPVVTTNITGLSIAPFTYYTFVHPTPWNTTTNGTYNVKVWASNLDGNADLDLTNDLAQKNVIVGPGIVNIIDSYVGINTPQPTLIADASVGILAPRDLDFHPTLTNYDLWVILKSTEADGGKTVKISNAGQVGQTELVQQDDNAWHFMSLPTGIAFSENGNFATSPGVFDANHDGGAAFTGPTLWSSDPSIYAQPSGGNGSHLDMLHESPYSMGIAHETDNAFWVNDGQNNCVTRYDFVQDHGPGNSDHSDGTVRRYSGMGLVEEPSKHVASHLVLDKTNNWLYIVDTGNDRVLRMDINSGSATGTFVPNEATAESSIYTGYASNVYISTGLTEPSGIDLIGDRLIVSDHATGEIIIYDCSGGTGVELQRLQTGTPGVMGVTIGPDGKIWYVNATTNQVIRLEAMPVSINEEIHGEISANIYPNPVADGNLNISTNIPGNYKINLMDLTGQLLETFVFSSTKATINTGSIPAGNYFIQIIDDRNNTINKKFIVAK
jgi:Secretion system C-terminal sorting domain